jgi:PASTA domain-containing protein
MAILYVDCTEDRGIRTTSKLSGGVKGSFELVSNASLNAASEKTREEDRAVALQKIKDCFVIAERTSKADDPERPAVAKLKREYARVKTLPPTYTVPDILDLDLTPEQAKGVLEAIGFKVERVEEASNDVEKDKVIRTEPTAGETAGKGSTVKLVISTGPATESPTVTPTESPTVTPTESPTVTPTESPTESP